MKNTIKKLQEIADNIESSDLKTAVAESIISHLDGYDEPEQFFNDLFQGGCVSGFIGELIYYKDTYAFFDKYYSDIMDLVYEYKEQGIEVDLMKDNNIKNTGAWFAYEETARQIADELGFDI